MTAALGLRAVRDGTMSYTHFPEGRKMQKQPYWPSGHASP